MHCAERGDLAERADAELGRVRDDNRAGGLAEPGLLDGGVVEGEFRPAVFGVHAADGHDEAVEGQGFQRPQGERPDQGTFPRAGPAADDQQFNPGLIG